MASLENKFTKWKIIPNNIKGQQLDARLNWITLTCKKRKLSELFIKQEQYAVQEYIIELEKKLYNMKEKGKSINEQDSKININKG